MKKVIAMVLAMAMMLSMTAFAAPTFKLGEDATVAEGTTVTPAADSIAVSTATTAGNYYGILLVKGNALPTVDSDILYINQATAAAATTAFDVKPIIPEAGTEMTLYISSNVDGDGLISVPMVYAEEVVAPTYQLAEIDGDGDPAQVGDALQIINYVNWEPSALDAYIEDVAAMTAMAEIDGDGDPAQVGDALQIINYVNWEPSTLDTLLQ